MFRRSIFVWHMWNTHGKTLNHGKHICSKPNQNTICEKCRACAHDRTFTCCVDERNASAKRGSLKTLSDKRSGIWACLGCPHRAICFTISPYFGGDIPLLQSILWTTNYITHLGFPGHEVHDHESVWGRPLLHLIVRRTIDVGNTPYIYTIYCWVRFVRCFQQQQQQQQQPKTQSETLPRLHGWANGKWDGWARLAGWFGLSAWILYCNIRSQIVSYWFCANMVHAHVYVLEMSCIYLLHVDLSVIFKSSRLLFTQAVHKVYTWCVSNMPSKASGRLAEWSFRLPL